MSKTSVRQTRVLLTMIFWAALVRGVSSGSPSGHAQEPTSAQSSEKSASTEPASGRNDTPARGQKDQTKRPGVPTAKTRDNRAAVTHAQPAPRRQRHSAKTTANNLRTETLQNVPDSHHASPTLSSNNPGKTVRHSSPPMSSSTAALNGQQFKNSRDPGARMASNGGLANSTRGTAVINGSEIKPKP